MKQMAAEPIDGKSSPFPGHLVALGLLGLAHLPFVAVQCQTLWRLEYYQFFPFAFAAFAYLFHQRAVRGSFRWGLINSALVALDVVLLVAGALYPSPFLVYVGAVVLCFAVSRSYADNEFDCSLGYLILLLVITIRIPLGYDAEVIAWLQTATTRVGSRLLNFFGFLHLRQGNVIEFPDKRFLVEEACSGVQSLFTVLFLATLVICGYRRKLLHAVLVLGTGFACAGLMNVLRIFIISVAWSQSQVDLSTGWQHDAIGYAALAAAAFLVFSADAFWDFFFFAVPDTRGMGVSSIHRNPLIVLWNRVFWRPPRQSAPKRKPGIRPGLSAMLMAGAALVCVSTMALQVMAL